MPPTSESDRGGAFSLDPHAANRIRASRRILVSCTGAHHQRTTFGKGSGFRVRLALCQGEIRGSKAASILTGDPNDPKDGQKNHTALRPCGSGQNTAGIRARRTLRVQNNKKSKTPLVTPSLSRSS